MENQNSNPLLCDIEKGICEMPSTTHAAQADKSNVDNKPVKVIYYTDPICSSCWGIEPQVRKLKLEYGASIEIEYRMGGLLPDWSYNSGGISSPSDVAHHWDEASAYYDMPIDGDVWLEDPLSSSYPPSIAFKAAQMQDKEKAVQFLREIRELLFLHKKNITKWENISLAAQKAGLDIAQLKKDYEGEAKQLFAEDLELAQKLGVSGFPTMFFVDGSGGREKVYGAKPYTVFERAVTTLQPRASKNKYETGWKNLFSKHTTLTSREFAELSGTPRAEADAFLQKLQDAGNLEKSETKNGALWRSIEVSR
jgi:putative protein-disulfide isomerase